jgi:hypothetical protein
MQLFQLILAIVLSLWIIGSAVAVGLFLALRQKSGASTAVGIVWALVFSWAFVGWMAGGFFAQALKVLVLNIQRCATHRPKGC